MILHRPVALLLCWESYSPHPNSKRVLILSVGLTITLDCGPSYGSENEPQLRHCLTSMRLLQIRKTPSNLSQWAPIFTVLLSHLRQQSLDSPLQLLASHNLSAMPNKVTRTSGKRTFRLNDITLSLYIHMWWGKSHQFTVHKSLSQATGCSLSDLPEYTEKRRLSSQEHRCGAGLKSSSVRSVGRKEKGADTEKLSVWWKYGPA